MKNIFIFLLILIAFSCSKEQIVMPISVERLPMPVNVESIIYKKPYLYAGGGAYRSGAVYRRHIDSIEWTLVADFPQKINAIIDFGENMLFIGDSLFATIYDQQSEEIREPYHYEYFIPYPKTVSNFKKALTYENGTIFISEFNQIAGNIYYSPDKAENQHIKMQEDNGLFGIAQFHRDSAIICGYGQIFSVNMNDWTQNLRDISGEIFTSIDHKDGQMLVCSFGGDIFSSADNGINWNKQFASGKKRNANVRLNEIAFISNAKALAVGEKGAILISEDNGESWAEIKNSCYEKLLSIATVNNIIYIGGSGGTILSIADPIED